MLNAALHRDPCHLKSTAGFSVNFLECESVLVNVWIRKIWFKKIDPGFRIRSDFTNTMLEMYVEYILFSILPMPSHHKRLSFPVCLSQDPHSHSCSPCEIALGKRL